MIIKGANLKASNHKEFLIFYNNNEVHHSKSEGRFYLQWKNHHNTVLLVQDTFSNKTSSTIAHASTLVTLLQNIKYRNGKVYLKTHNAL
jgi:hypothetical protein